MLGISGKWRIKVYNASGVALNAGDLSVKVRLQKYTTSGALTESAETTVYSNAASLATATYEAGAWQDNTVTLYLALHGIARLVTTGAPNGTVRVFLESATDYSAAPTNPPTDGRGWLLTEFYHTAAATELRPIRF